MASTATKCSTCGKTFYVTGFGSTCPDCKRDKENYQKVANLQENQQRHEKNLKEKELEQRQRISEQNRSHDQELFRKQQDLEEYKMRQQRYLQEEVMTKQELDSIKNKVYTLAANNTDNANISRLINLLLHQHREQNEFIYNSIIALGEPYEKIIKDLISIRIKDTIDKMFCKSNYSFQRKSLKYFMPEFNGYEFEVFSDILINKVEFENSIQEEIQETEFDRIKFTENKRQEIKESKKIISNFENAIENDTYSNNALRKSIITSQKLFGEEMSSIPRLNILFVALYVGYIYYFHNRFEWVVLFILMTLGYIVTYTIISTNKKRENNYKETDEVISQNNATLRNLVVTKSELETEIIDNDYEKLKLTEALINFSQSNQP